MTARGGRSGCWWVVVGCVGLVLAMTTCACASLALGAAAYRLRYPPVSTDPQVVMDLVDDEAAALRELPYLEPVEFTLATTDELREMLEEELAEEWSEEEARDQVLVLAALDLIDPDTDLYNLLLDLQAEGVAGYYDTDDKTLRVVSDTGAINGMQRAILAHELVHALQDQYFDLDGFVGDEVEETLDSEAESARQALVEGDASLVGDMYDDSLAPHEILTGLLEAMDQGFATWFDAPPVIIETIMFPYTEGLSFVRDLHERGGWAAVDAAYEDPPQSTEHILHPERYHAGDKPRIVALPPLTDTLGTEWGLVEEEVIGELSLRQHLDTYITRTLAADAAEGWGGDRFAVYHRDDMDQSVLVMHTVWDTFADAHAFHSAYERFIQSALAADGPGDAVETSSADSGARCWSGDGDTRCLWWAGDEVIVVRAPDADIGQRVLATLLE